MGSRKRTTETTSGRRPGPVGDPRAMMERVMREIGKLDLEDMTPEEANDYIQEQLASGRLYEATAETPLEQAQELVYQAWEATGRRKQTLARRALEISPDCADAYVILAEAARTPEEARDLYQKGVEAGERAIGPEAFAELEGEFWGVIHTRPYMRAREGLARVLWILDETEQAAEHHADMLRLNPNDNQGIRYIQVECLIELGRDWEALALLNRYKGDVAAAWAYARALLAFREGGANRKAGRALAKAMEANPFVPPYLLALVPLPEQLPALIGLGDEAEAMTYVVVAIPNWDRTPDALDWLASEWGKAVLHKLRQEMSASQSVPAANRELQGGGDAAATDTTPETGG
jgi:tetratricopeptide (TPR) repeat protein